MTYQDFRNAARRAQTSIDNAAALRNDPGNPNAVLNRGMAINPGINGSRGRYQYQVIVVGRGNGETFETLVTIHARSRLSADQLGARAERAFLRGENMRFSYAPQRAALGGMPTLDTFVIGVSRTPNASEIDR